MLKHIVLWKLKEEALGKPKGENARELKRRLEALKGPIADIVELEVGFEVRPSPSSYDVALYSLFQDAAGLERYQKHPEHLKVVEFVKAVTAERRSVDYEV